MELKNEQPQNGEGNSSQAVVGMVKQQQEVQSGRLGREKWQNLHWTHQQHYQYLTFLQLNKPKLKSRRIRHCTKFFEKMALFMKVKSALQCRGHHKKMEEKYRYPYRILKDEISKMGRNLHEFELQVDQLTKQPQYRKYVVVSRNEDEEEMGQLERATTGSSVEVQTEIAAVNALILTRKEYENRQRMLNRAVYPFASYYPTLNLPSYHSSTP